MTTKKYLILFVFLWFCFFLSGYAGPGESKETEGITLTWQDFRELLGLDSETIKITWTEFRKLLAQTGNQINMDIEIKDGVVTLKKEQFRQILNKMRPPLKKIPPPPTLYLVSEAKYEGSAGDQDCRFSASFEVYLFRQESPGYVKIPILSSQAALSEISLDGVPAVIQTSGSWHCVTLDKSGFHQVKVVFSIGHNRQSFSLPVVRSIINRIDFFIPEKDLEIDLPSSLNAKISDLSKGTRFTANLALTGLIKINWNRKIEKREKKPALFYAATHSLITAASDIIKVKSTIDLEILQHSLEKISLLVPKNYEVIKVEAQTIDNWQVRETDSGRILEIYFGFDINRDFNFTVYSERILAADTLGVDYSGLQVIDARREGGSIGVVAENAVEVQVLASKELEKQEFHQLPQRILNMSSRPILYAYKYAQHPFRLDIAIQKHERLEGMATVIESASATVLFLEEGKVIYKIIYTLRNSFKQFMELELPDEARIWTVLVDNKREKASRGKKGKVLIPLVRSPGNGEELSSFNVELIYTLPLKKFGFSGKSECLLPGSDIFINKMRIAMFMPEGFSYRFDKGEWKEEKTVLEKKERKDLPKPSAPGVEEEKPQPSVKTEGKFQLDGVDISQPQSGEYISKELMDSLPSSRRLMENVTVMGRASQAGVLTGPAGLDSINVHLPLSGIKYLFSKNIIDKGEKSPLKFSYFSKNLQKGILYLIIVVAFIVLLILLLRKIKRKKASRL